MRTRPPAHPLLGLALALAHVSTTAAQDVVVAAADTAPAPSEALPLAATTDAVIVIELVPASPAMIEAPATAYAPLPAPAEASEEAAPEDDAPREAPAFALGLSGLVGLRESGDGVTPTWTAGVDLALRVMPWARLSVRRIGYSQAQTLQGDRHAISASPALDLFVPLGDVLEPFAQIGALVQTRFGEGGARFGIAPFVGAGLRVLALDWLALEIEGALHVPATSHVLIGHELFPTASILLQLGAGAEARF
jgi:hypothetical protein